MGGKLNFRGETMNKFALTAILAAVIVIATPDIVCAKTLPTSTSHAKKHVTKKPATKHKKKTPSSKHTKHHKSKSSVKAGK